jgi:hypothetical protein
MTAREYLRNRKEKRRRLATRLGAQGGRAVGMTPPPPALDRHRPEREPAGTVAT